MTKTTSISIDDPAYSLCSKLNLSFHSYLLLLNSYFKHPKIKGDNIPFKRFWTFYVKHDLLLYLLLLIFGVILGFIYREIKSPILLSCALFLLLSAAVTICIDSTYIKDLNNQILIEPQYSQAYHFLSSIFKAIQEIEGIPNAENAMIWLFNHPQHSISLKILWDKNIRSGDDLKRLILLNFQKEILNNHEEIKNLVYQDKPDDSEILRFRQNIQLIVLLADNNEHESDLKDWENECYQKMEQSELGNVQLQQINNHLENLVVQMCSRQSFTISQFQKSVSNIFLK